MTTNPTPGRTLGELAATDEPLRTAVPAGVASLAGLVASTHTTAIEAAQSAKRAARTYLKAVDLLIATGVDLPAHVVFERAEALKAADAATDLCDRLSNI